MGKLANYIIFLSVILLLFHFGGLIDTGGISYILDVIEDPANFTNADFYTTIYLIIIGVATLGAIAIGTLTRSSPEFYIMMGMALLLITLVSEFIVLYNSLAQLNNYLAVLIISPLMIVFTLTVVEWWRGRD
jgi:hypothetical protein